jgi:hypothetical protein
MYTMLLPDAGHGGFSPYEIILLLPTVPVLLKTLKEISPTSNVILFPLSPPQNLKGI